MDDKRGTNAPLMRKAQGSTEYIVLLGVLLVLTLIAIGLLNMFPNSSSEIRISLSKSYWGSTSPFAIYEHSMTSDGLLNVTIFNRGPKTLRLEGMKVAGDEVSGQNLSVSELASGKQIARSIELGYGYRPYQTYTIYVNLTYADADSELPGQMQLGREPIVGHCNGELSVPPGSCGGLKCIGEACVNPNECFTHFCHDVTIPANERLCQYCVGNGNCPGPYSCVLGICVPD